MFKDRGEGIQETQCCNYLIVKCLGKTLIQTDISSTDWQDCVKLKYFLPLTLIPH